MSYQQWYENIVTATTSGTAVANTTTETIAYGNITLPSNYMQNSRSFKLTVLGQYSTTATPTVIFSLRWGGVAGTLICKTAACTLPTITAGLWKTEIWCTTRSNGSSGTIMGNGEATVYAGVAGTVASATGEGLVTPMTNGGVLTPAVATLDLTADTALSITATWSAASASNTLTGLNYYLDSMN
jgi:hypothetical protein